MKLENIRCTVFIDKFLPFSIELSNLFKNKLNNQNLTPVILNDFQPFIFSPQPYQNWCLSDGNYNRLEIHGNKIDIFFNETDETSASKFFADIILKLTTELNFRTQRLAFAPTYSNADKDMFEKILKAPAFKNANMQEFSMNRVYYKIEEFDTYSFNVIYNGTVGMRLINQLGQQDTKRLVISNDINTKDTGNRFYSPDEITIFYEKVILLNKEFLSLLIGDTI